MVAESSIPVDLLNPGQVFACLGILEAVDVLLGDAKATFDWNERGGVAFRVSACGSIPPVERVMQFLDEAQVLARAPAESPNLNGWKQTWGNPPKADAPEEPFPFPDPNSPATLPALLVDQKGHEIAIEHWGDATYRDNVKFWAGMGGYPGAALLRDAIRAVHGQFLAHASKPFSMSREQSNSFRFDWRRDYIPLQDGFSPNKHREVQMVGFPLVEVLATVGMANSRPCRRHKLEYTYGVLGCRKSRLLDPALHRAALGAERSPVPGWPFRRFAMQLDWPGKEGQARCITQVLEEATDI